MILLDTNVVSELMRFEPNSSVLAWINSQPKSSLYLCSVVLAEQLVGIEYLPAGRRKQSLKAGFDEIRTSLFRSTPVLAFTEQSASFYAKLMALAQTKGVQLGVSDGQIAALAFEHNFSVATRDTEPFEAAGVKVINPWS